MPTRYQNVLSWASILEDQTREQAERTASLPFIQPHLALMPDAHLGLGSTIGSVIPTLGAVIPAAVGVDQGCGMAALHLPIHKDDLPPTDTLDDLRTEIQEAIPLSPGNYNTSIRSPGTYGRALVLEETAGIDTADKLAPNWRLQLGSLGGGNHFIEVCLDENDEVWLFLHSGSRGVGNKIAQHHIKIAKKYCDQHWIPLPNPDLAYLTQGTNQFDNYIRDLNWAQKFARFNREEMMSRVAEAFTAWADTTTNTNTEHPAKNKREFIDCHHNYTRMEHHYGKDVWLTRKGAIDATKGTPGLIPGSMGTHSYVVTGKGNPQSLNSSPHGAGRNHSRRRARELFTHDDLRSRMQGISWRDSDAFVDEHPDAYKDVTQVMRDSRDLVQIEHTLRQLINVKGT